MILQAQMNFQAPNQIERIVSALIHSKIFENDFFHNYKYIQFFHLLKLSQLFNWTLYNLQKTE